MDFYTYFSWIIDCNLEQLNVTNLHKFADTFGFGLIEEYGEFNVASTPMNAVKEAGDVMAYTCLLARSLNLPLCELYFQYRNEAEPPNELVVAGFMKRYFRGDDLTEDKYREFTICLIQFMNHCIFSSGCVLEEITSINRLKLEDRLARTATFKGTGDNR